jgi:hypothetical protein
VWDPCVGCAIGGRGNNEIKLAKIGERGDKKPTVTSLDPSDRIGHDGEGVTVRARPVRPDESAPAETQKRTDNNYFGR